MFKNNRTNEFLGISNDANDGRQTADWRPTQSDTTPLSKRGVDLGREVSRDKRQEIKTKTWDLMMEETDVAWEEQDKIDKGLSKEEKAEIERAASKLIKAAIDKKKTDDNNNREVGVSKTDEPPKELELSYRDIDLPQDISFFRENAMKDPFSFISEELRQHIVDHPFFMEILLYYLDIYNVNHKNRKDECLAQIITNAEACGLGFRKVEAVKRSYFAVYFKFSKKYDKELDRVDERDELLLENIESKKGEEAVRSKKEKIGKVRIEKIELSELNSFLQDGVHVILVYSMSDVGSMMLDNANKRTIRKVDQFKATGKFYTFFFNLK